MLTLQTGLVWPTIAFSAEILEWSFDFLPPVGNKRHHVKVVPTVLEPVVELWMTIKETEPVKMDWTAVGKLPILLITALGSTQPPRAAANIEP